MKPQLDPGTPALRNQRRGERRLKAPRFEAGGFGPFWDHVGSMLGAFWDHFGTMLGACREHFGIVLGPFWDNFLAFRVFNLWLA